MMRVHREAQIEKKRQANRVMLSFLQQTKDDSEAKTVVTTTPAVTRITVIDYRSSGNRHVFIQQ